jgi:hypothetical protein
MTATLGSETDLEESPPNELYNQQLAEQLNVANGTLQITKRLFSELGNQKQNIIRKFGNIDCLGMFLPSALQPLVFVNRRVAQVGKFLERFAGTAARRVQIAAGEA